MMRGVTITVGLMAGLVLGGGTSVIASDSSDQPYGAIVKRNLFALNPADKTAESEQQKGPPPPKITLNGITSILGRLQVLFKASVSAKPGDAAKDMSFVLSEGQRESDIEILEINEATGTVKFNNRGTVQTLNLEKDGAKMPGGGGGGAPAGTAPGFPALPGGGGSGPRTIPPRTLRLPAPTPNAPADQSSQAAPTPPPVLTGTTFPQVTVPTAAAAQPQQMSPEEQYILSEANKQVHEERRKKNPNLPPLPPMPPLPGAPPSSD